MMNSSKRILVRVLLGYMCMFLPYWAFQSFLFKNVSENTVFNALIPYAVLYFIGFPLLYLICHQVCSFQFDQKERLHISSALKLFAFQSSTGFFVLAIAAAMLSVFGWKSANGAQISLVSCIKSLVIAPIAEEFVFRWFIYGKLRTLGLKTAAIVTSLLFAAAHLVSQGIPQAVYVFWMSLIWCYCRERYGSFKLNVLLHIGSNFWCGILPALIADSTVFQLAFRIVNIGLLSIVIYRLLNRQGGSKNERNARTPL